MKALSRLLLFFAAIAAFALPAQSGEIALILSDSGGVFSEFSEQLQKSLAGSNWRISAVVLPDNLATAAGVQRATLWLSLGEEATRTALASGKAPALIASLLGRYQFEQLLKEQSFRPPGGITALVLDQPLARQLLFIDSLLPGKKRLGFLLASETEARSAQIHQQALNHGFAAEFEAAGDDDSVLPAANRLFARSDAVLALPDSRLFNRSNLRPLMLASFRLQRPLIGYSPAMVQAGAIAALYSTPGQLAEQIAHQLVTPHPRPALVQYPENFTFAYNHQAARSLGLDLPEEPALMRTLKKARNSP